MYFQIPLSITIPIPSSDVYQNGDKQKCTSVYQQSDKQKCTSGPSQYRMGKLFHMGVSRRNIFFKLTHLKTIILNITSTECTSRNHLYYLVTYSMWF